MEFVTATTIMQKCVTRIKELTTSESQNLASEMTNLSDIVQIKETKDVDKLVAKIEMKFLKKKKKKDDIDKKLKALREYSVKELEFKNNIILENCTLIIQQQQKHNELMLKEKLIYEHKISLNEKLLKNSKEKLQETIAKAIQQFESLRSHHMNIEKDTRMEWLALKQTLSDTLLKYDVEMIEQQDELEFIQRVKEDEEKELQHYKTTCASQEITYFELMKEKEDYLEEERQKKLYEIRLKIAKRTIVKFIEQHYPAWKKRKLRASKKKSKYKFKK